MVDYDRSTALIVVDVQNDFADPKGSLYVGEGELDGEGFCYGCHNRLDRGTAGLPKSGQIQHVTWLSTLRRYLGK